ncbi:uncharacterized protein N7503_000945 [Penicillium pulvis]|uniref:uncharacterized protein n=1 Tax=Penicillium pulvis TaxID=1562058 RepID=UPI0025488337|nr:uncharacterized protein N7503_000945 [Penicillium pulvis]KAJ5814195.1 hypothetical protein N7503_000945 [Penicillium pulvis]
MKAPEETTRGGVGNSSTNGVASSQKRPPPKLRPPKLSKQTRPLDRQSQGSQQRQTGGSQRSQSSSLSEHPDGIAEEQNEDNLDASSADQASESPQIHHQRTVRRESAPSGEPDRVEVIEREQRANSPEGNSPQANRQETRVRRMLNPEVKDKEMVRAPDPHRAGQQGESSRNGLDSTTGDVVETTEEVTDKKSNDQLRLRLDLNLDIEIELKAKIRGDLTLQLLQ